MPRSFTWQQYEDYIRSYEWSKKRQEALAFYGEFCAKCGSVKFLQIHHLSYDRLFNEPMEDLQVLCDSCHAKAHNKTPLSKGGRPKIMFRLSSEAILTLDKLSKEWGVGRRAVLEMALRQTWERWVEHGPPD